VIPTLTVPVSLTFARSSNFITWSMLPNHATTDIYMFMGGKGKHAPQNITHVSIDESVEEIATDTFNKCKILDEVIIHGNVLRIKEEAFNRCPSLRRVVFQKNAFITIEQNTFNECRNLHVVMMPHAVNMILEGNFISMKPYINQQSLPNVDQDAFYKCPIEVVDNCIRSSILLCLWRWVLKKQVK